MNFLQLMESQMPAQRVPHTQVAQPSPSQHVIRHRDPNLVISLVVVICFVALSIGMVVLTAHLERLGKSKTHEPAHNVPMVRVGE